MNRQHLTLYGLKWNPFATDLPVEGLMTTPAVDSFCRRIEHHLVRQGGFALIAGEPGAGKRVTLRLLAKRLERTDGLNVAVLRQLDALADAALDPEGQGARRWRLARPRAPCCAGGVAGSGIGSPGQVDAVIPAPGRNRESRCGARRLPIPSPKRDSAADKRGLKLE